MKTAATLLSICMLYLAPAGQACADNCSQAARAAASQRGAQVLQVKSVQQGGRTICVITLRVPGANGKPPRVATVRVGG